MKSNEIFQIKLDKNWQESKYILGCDPYDEDSSSFSVGVITKSKPQYKIKKIKSFKRVINIGWTYIVELIK